jgi:hypothetical protein
MTFLVACVQTATKDDLENHVKDLKSVLDGYSDEIFEVEVNLVRAEAEAHKLSPADINSGWGTKLREDSDLYMAKLAELKEHALFDVSPTHGHKCAFRNK